MGQTKNMSHRLAAILFTDIVGYTAMMQRDEEEAAAAIRRHRRILKRTVPRYGGELLQHYGDGSLSIFPSASEAVFCAADLQEQFRQAPTLFLRMGLHLGEIYFEGDQFMGDGINIAARIEAEAKPGSIYASEDLWKVVKNQTSLRGVPIGTRPLKNVAGPVRLYRLEVTPLKHPPLSGRVPASWPGLLAGLVVVILLLIGIVIGPWRPSPKQALERSVAVLPFDNFSERGAVDQYLCNGIHEAVLNHLSQLDNLEVKSRSSVESFRKKRPPADEIGRRLRAAYLLEGSVQRIDDRLRVTVQLVEASTGNHFWSQVFERQITDIFFLQSTIAAEVVSELAVQLSPQQQARLQQAPTTSFEAYDHYLRGNERLQRYVDHLDSVDIAECVRLFRKARSLDNNFALPLLGIAYAYWQQYRWRPEAAPEKLDSVKLLIDQVLELDPRLAEGHFAAGIFALMEEGREGRAINYLQRAIELKPSYANAHNQLAMVYRLREEPAKALWHLQRAVLLDPSKQLPTYYSNTGYVYLGMGDFEQAQAYFYKALDIDPDYRIAFENLLLSWAGQGQFDSMLPLAQRLQERWPNHSVSLFWLADTYMELEEYELARHYYEALYDLPGDQQRFHYFDSRHRYGYVLWQMGERAAAREQFERQRTWYLQTVESAGNARQPIRNFTYDLAAIYAFLGQREEALKWLSAFASTGWHWGSPYYIEVDRLFTPLRTDPEFQTMVREAQKKKAEQRSALEATSVFVPSLN